MSTRHPLNVTTRTVTGKQLGPLRRSGLVPGVVMGGGQDSQPIAVPALDWEILRRKHVTRNSLLDLSVDGKKGQTVMVKAIVEHPVNRRPVHIDLQRVSLTESMVADIPLVFVGEAYAVAKAGGTLLHVHETLHVRAAANDLPESIEVDISRLADFDAVIHVSDIVAPKGVTILTDANEAIARVQAPRVEAAEPGTPSVAPAPAAEAASEA